MSRGSVTARTEFRLLVLFNALLIPVAMFVSTHDFRLQPPELQAWMAARGAMLATPLQSIGATVSFVSFVALCIGLVGLLAFHRWARWLTLVSTIVLYVPMPLSGTLVLSGFAYTLDSVAAILWGVLLAAAYWSPVADEFRPRARRPVAVAASA